MFATFVPKQPVPNTFARVPCGLTPHRLFRTPRRSIHRGDPIDRSNRSPQECHRELASFR